MLFIRDSVVFAFVLLCVIKRKLVYVGKLRNSGNTSVGTVLRTFSLISSCTKYVHSISSNYNRP